MFILYKDFKTPILREGYRDPKKASLLEMRDNVNTKVYCS